MKYETWLFSYINEAPNDKLQQKATEKTAMSAKQ